MKKHRLAIIVIVIINIDTPEYYGLILQNSNVYFRTSFRNIL